MLDGDCLSSEKENRRYAKVHRQFNGYIFMEEAICNTAAYAWLRHSLNCSLVPDHPKANELLTAVKSWMETQPKGYSSFIPLDEPPYTSRVFIENVVRLLFQIYADAQICPALDKREVEAAVAEYFGCTTVGEQQGNRSDSERGNLPCFRKFPLYICNNKQALDADRYKQGALVGSNDEAGLGSILDII